MRLGNRIYRVGVKCLFIFQVYYRSLLYHNLGLEVPRISDGSTTQSTLTKYTVLE